MCMKILPQTRWGTVAVGLIVLMVVLLVAGMNAVQLYDGVAAGKTILLDIEARPLVALTMLAGFAAGLTSLACSTVALLRHKDRALLVVVAFVIGLLLAVFLAAEIVSPH